MLGESTAMGPEHAERVRFVDHEDGAVAPLHVEDGRMHAPGGRDTGVLGVALDERVVRRFEVEAAEAG